MSLSRPPAFPGAPRAGAHGPAYTLRSDLCSSTHGRTTPTTPGCAGDRGGAAWGLSTAGVPSPGPSGAPGPVRAGLTGSAAGSLGPRRRDGGRRPETPPLRSHPSGGVLWVLWDSLYFISSLSLLGFWCLSVIDQTPRSPGGCSVLSEERACAQTSLSLMETLILHHRGFAMRPVGAVPLQRAANQDPRRWHHLGED